MNDIAIQNPLREIDMVLDRQPAKLNITYQGQQGDLPNDLPYDLSDAEILRIATEALTAGIPGINADPAANLKDFVVDRFPARDDVPYNRLSLRPKTPFGGR